MLIESNVGNDKEYARALALLQVLTEHGFGLVNLHGVDPFTGACSCIKRSACDAKGKHPYRRGWQNSMATTSTEVLKLLKLSTAKLPTKIGDKQYYVRSNIAVACGLESKIKPGKYLVIIDIDNNQEMVDKLDAWTEPTINYFTGSGGKHYLYLSDKPINNSVSTLAPGVDVRGAGGYALIPPSTNSKGDYGRFGPSMIIRDLPEFLKKELASIQAQPARKKPSKSSDGKKEPKAKSEKNSTNKAKPDPEAEKAKKLAQRGTVHQLLAETDTIIPNGLRNQTLYIYLCRLRARGTLKGKLFDAAREMIATRFANPETFSEHELTTLVTSVAKHPPYVHTHSEMLRVFVEWAIKNNSIPEQFGKRTFDFRKAIYNLDRQFFKLALPTYIRNHIKETGYGPTMASVSQHRDDYYRELGYSISNYPKMTPTQIGCVFTHDYPFYKVFDKVRNKVRRYEWFILDKEYEEFMIQDGATRSQRLDQDHVATNIPPPPVPPQPPSQNNDSTKASSHLHTSPLTTPEERKRHLEENHTVTPSILTTSTFKHTKSTLVQGGSRGEPPVSSGQPMTPASHPHSMPAQHTPYPKVTPQPANFSTVNTLPNKQNSPVGSLGTLDSSLFPCLSQPTLLVSSCSSNVTGHAVDISTVNLDVPRAVAHKPSGNSGVSPGVSHALCGFGLENKSFRDHEHWDLRQTRGVSRGNVASELPGWLGRRPGDGWTDCPGKQDVCMPSPLVRGGGYRPCNVANPAELRAEMVRCVTAENLTTVPMGAKVHSQPVATSAPGNNTTAGFQAVEPRRKVCEVEHHANEDQHCAAELSSGAEGLACSDRSAGRVCGVEHGRTALQSVREAADGSCIEAAWDWSSVQRTDHEAGSERTDSGQLPDGNDHIFSHPGDVVWGSGCKDCNTD